MTDIETLRREFEAAYANDPDSKHKEYGRDLFVWNEHGNHYRYEHVHNVFKGFCMGRLPAQAEIERLRDIVRQFRIEAHDQQLINDSEYESLAGDGESVARLRVYDDMRIEIERLQAVVDRLLATIVEQRKMGREISRVCGCLEPGEDGRPACDPPCISCQWHKEKP